MPFEDLLDDDIVADMLKKDARDSSIRYSSLGLQAYLPKRPVNAAPKPNTRFLQNIIRETDNHNAALRAREIQDSRTRLKQLGKRSEQCTYPPEPGLWPSDNRPENNGPDSKRRKVHGCDKNDRHQRRFLDPSESENEKNRRQCSNGRAHRKRQTEYSSHKFDKGQYSRSSRVRHHQHRKYDRIPTDVGGRRGSDEKRPFKEKSRSSSSEVSEPGYHKQRSRSPAVEKSSPISPHFRSNHLSDARGLSPNRSSSRRRGFKLSGSKEKINKLSSSRSRFRSASSTDSDPLCDLIGPSLPLASSSNIIPRGRGVLNQSIIDSHFSPNYNPSLDMQPNAESDDDWDQALEAMRDRQLWKERGAQRLREAGFSEGEVTRLERGTEYRTANLRWGRKGEGREWDRGKHIGIEGEVTTGAEWDSHLNGDTYL
ncbi:MAG: hypothetical protein M1834_003429 [Cirrosporium novae-zelandiae]|nr:MAG: hypothetical protein M1834_003429 [Cirrosporium novae-zelandiae]